MKLYAKELAAALPPAIFKVCSVFKDNGYNCWLVGGCVRDFFLRHRFSDFDMVSDARPDETQRIFKNTVDIGSQYGTILVKEDGLEMEVTTLREESGYADGRHPENIVFCNDLKTDLARRDFTINSIAYDPQKREIYDYYNGLDDLQNRIISTVGDPDKRFSEDGLRLLRACRFVAQLNFELDDNVFLALQENKDMLLQVSAERISAEFIKLLKAPAVDEGLMVLKETGLLETLFPKIDSLNDEIWKYLLEIIKTADPELRLLILAKLFQDTYGAVDTEQLLINLKIKKETIRIYIQVLRFINFVYDKHMTDASLRNYIQRLKKETVPLWLSLYKLLAGFSGSMSQSEQKRMEDRFKKVIDSPLSYEDLAISGDDLIKLGIPEGAKVGHVLQKLLDIIIEYPSKNTWSQLIGYAREIKKTL
ncbi:MAG: CCA tRNA nucleotidyltransferase [Candidatus Margulisiibacteriota bacterium]